MRCVKRLTVITLCMAGIGWGQQVLYAQESAAIQHSSEPQPATPPIPTLWTWQNCIEYALQQNITLKKSRIDAQSSAIDVKSAKAALFPNLSFSTSQNVVNRPFQESSSYVSGSEILQSSNKTSYNGNYGLNAQWLLYNGNKRLKTIEQEQLNNRATELQVSTQENSIQESITQMYVQILYAAESVKVNEGTVAVSKAQLARGNELLHAGTLSKVDLAQLEAQVSADHYQLVTSQASLQNYKLQLKQLLELDGEAEMNLYLPALDDASVLASLPSQTDVYAAALAIRPEIEASKIGVRTSQLSIDMARAGYLPSINLSAGIGTNHTSGSDFTFAQQAKTGWNNSLGVSISVPIFNNRQTKSAVQKAKLQQQTSMLNLLDEQKMLYKTIEGVWLDAHTAQQQYVAAQEKLRSTQTSYQLIDEQFNLGMKNTVELLTEKSNLLQAQQQSLQAKYMALLNTQLLKFYQGESIEL